MIVSKMTYPNVNTKKIHLKDAASPIVNPDIRYANPAPRVDNPTYDIIDSVQYLV
jgi:hypothetical protein